jgi:transposase InsO family protein
MRELIGAGVSRREACRSIGASRATWNRWQQGSASPPRALQSARTVVQPHALSPRERAEVLVVCNSERFCNSAPRAIVATLLDEGRYLASASTFYRILGAEGQLHERRAIASHPARVKPELLTTSPNELWSWDITKLPGPAKWTWFSLYLVLDVFSRFIVAWEVATRESAAIAKALFSEAAREQRVQPGQLHVHADSGSPMKGQVACAVLRRSRYFQDAFATARFQRQPLLRSPLQDAQVPSGVSRVLPLGRRRARLHAQPRALVQLPTSAQRPCVRHAGRRAFRPCTVDSVEPNRSAA